MIRVVSKASLAHTLYLVISASDINRGFSAGFWASAMAIWDDRAEEYKGLRTLSGLIW